MKHLWIAAVALAMLPTVTLAGDRGDRYERGRKHYDRGSRYEHRDYGHRSYKHHSHGHHHKHKSHSSFSFSFGLSSGGYYGDSFSSFHYGYGNYHRPVYVEAPVYYPAPAVIYTPPPRVYYYAPLYTPRYYFGGRYSYCR